MFSKFESVPCFSPNNCVLLIMFTFHRIYLEISICYSMDKLHMALTELCFALNYCSTINVWEYTFAPREYLHQHLENRFARALVGMVMFNPDTSEIAKPSELLASVRAYMNVLQTVENYGKLPFFFKYN